MALVCAYTVLKLHSQGKSFAPVMVNLGGNIRYRLQNADGDILVGLHGNFYNFKSEKTARNWLCSNLGRVANSDAPTSEDYLGQLFGIYSKSQDAFVLQEINTINELDKNQWQPIECNAQIVYVDNTTKDWDGGDAFNI